MAARLSMAWAGLFLSGAERGLLRRRTPYADWVAANAWTVAARDDLVAALARHGGNLPKISVIMPVYRPDLAHLRAALDSVAAQVYADWELCVADDGSDDPALAAELEARAAAEPRIRCVVRARNGGISAATNTAAALAVGEVLVFLDQDDLLTPDALGEIALAFAEQPQLDLAFSDNDKVDARGLRVSPAFKPGWSPWLLLTYMYLGHALALRRSLFERLGGMRSAFDGSQDYDLALRAAETSRMVRHIPRVLYHWRVLPGSTALRAGEKPGSIEAGRRAVAEALVWRGLDASVERPEWAARAGIGLFDLRFAPPPSCTLLIIADDAMELDDDWRAGLAASLPQGAEVIVVGQVSPKRPSACDPGLGWRSIPSSPEALLSERLAEGLGQARGDAIILLTAGARVLAADGLARLAGLAMAPGVGLVGPRLVDSSGKVVAAGLVGSGQDGQLEPAFAGLAVHRPGALYLARTTRECVALPAICLAASRETLQRLADDPTGADDPTALGIVLSERAIRHGLAVLVCGQCDVVTERPLQVLGASLAARPGTDPWYHPALSSGLRQFLPACRSPGLRSSEPVRLAAVTHNLDQEGAQTVLADLLCGLQEARLAAPFVISGRDGPLRGRLERAGMTVEVVSAPSRRASRTAPAEYRLRLAAALGERGAQAVLANTLECHAAIGAAQDIGVGAIWWQHEGGSWQRYLRRLRWSVRASIIAAFQQATRVVTVAEAARQGWGDLAVRDNLAVVRHAIPPAWIEANVTRWSPASARSAARAELGLSPDDCCILLMGSVSTRKAQADVLAAFVALEESASTRLRLVIAGAFVDRGYQRKIAALVDRLPPRLAERVSLPGAVTDPGRYFAAADVFLCCSRQESAPRAMIEAMAFGLPIVTTPVDGIPELVQAGKNALFYNPGDVRELGRILVQLCSSRDERERLGRAARERFAVLNDHAGMVERFGALVREAAWRSRIGLAPAADGR